MYAIPFSYNSFTSQGLEANSQLDIPLSKDITVKDKMDWNLEDHVDVENFVEELGDRLDLNDDEKDKIEADISNQLIDHIEKTTLRTRMTKEQKILFDKIKAEDKEREIQVAENEAKVNRRKMGRGAELGIARRVNLYLILRSVLTAHMST